MARTHRRLTALVAFVALAGAACGSGGSGDDDAAGTTTTTTAAAAGSSSDDAATTTSPTAETGGDGGGQALERYADYQTQNYDDPSHWVCRPETTDDMCDSDLDSTTVAADGTLTVERFERAEDPPIDCFYVYPTISRDQTTYSDWNASPDEEGYVTLQQAARLASQCRVFAPVYRQRTLVGLGGGGEGADEGDPFADVLDAFRTYMAEDNQGRGVVLIGHSQGAGMLNQLIKTEIDPKDDVRAKLVSAYLAGGAVAVPEGEEVGGDFEQVPLCTSSEEAGCVVTWATFRSTAPPPESSFFGKPRGASPGDVAGCVNPADPEGGEGVEVHSYFPANHDASILTADSASGGSGWLAPSAGQDTTSLTTPFVSTPGLVTARCATKDGFTYLEATVHGDPSDPRADDIPGDLTPEWGLHLVDVNLVMGDIVDLVAKQAKAYAG